MFKDKKGLISGLILIVIILVVFSVFYFGFSVWNIDKGDTALEAFEVYATCNMKSDKCDQWSCIIENKDFFTDKKLLETKMFMDHYCEVKE